MKDGLFIAGLGLMLVFMGLLRVATRLLRKDLPKSTGFLRGQEIGAYFGVALGGFLVLVGLVAIVVDVFT